MVITSYWRSWPCLLHRSDDIRRLFTRACDHLAIAWRPWGRYHISVARQVPVAMLDSFIGPKR